jgi:hypothetical protein
VRYPGENGLLGVARSDDKRACEADTEAIIGSKGQKVL